MKAQSYFVKGEGHAVCEDYAFHNTDRFDLQEQLLYSLHIKPDHNKLLIAVSDGCSGADHTDFGARILIHSLLSQYYQNDFVNPKAVIAQAINSVPLHTVKDCLFATLLYAYVYDSKVHINVFGDGAVIYKKKGDEDYTILNYEYSNPGNNTELPYYLYHEVDNTYINKFPGYKLYVNGIESVQQPVPRIPPIPYYELEELYLFTDGVNSFYNKKMNTMEDKFMEFVKGVANKNNTNGEFLRRKVDHTLNKLSKKGEYNYDDIGVAAMIKEND